MILPKCDIKILQFETSKIGIGICYQSMHDKTRLDRVWN